MPNNNNREAYQSCQNMKYMKYSDDVNVRHGNVTGGSCEIITHGYELIKSRKLGVNKSQTENKSPYK